MKIILKLETLLSPGVTKYDLFFSREHCIAIIKGREFGRHGRRVSKKCLTNSMILVKL
jgi:hypothetical protein